jgi:hypothetical protein
MEKSDDPILRLETIAVNFEKFSQLDPAKQKAVLEEIKNDFEARSKEIKKEPKNRVDYSEFLRDDDIQQGDDGSDYITVNALVRIAREHAGMNGYDVEVVQSPQKENQWSATVVATVYFRNGQSWCGAADCRLGNARDGFHRYTTALAETRALGRALRRALGIEMCTLEEVRDRTGPLTPIQKQHIKVKFIDNGLFTLDDVSKVVGRAIDKVDVLTEEEAANAIETLTKKVNKKKLKGG